jgi:hypothetical protein
LAHGGVVPHIIIRSSRLRLGEFESLPQKDFFNTICQEATLQACPEMRGPPAAKIVRLQFYGREVPPPLTFKVSRFAQTLPSRVAYVVNSIILHPGPTSEIRCR